MTLGDLIYVAGILPLAVFVLAVFIPLDYTQGSFLKALAISVITILGFVWLAVIFGALVYSFSWGINGLIN